MNKSVYRFEMNLIKLYFSENTKYRQNPLSLLKTTPDGRRVVYKIV